MWAQWTRDNYRVLLLFFLLLLFFGVYALRRTMHWDDPVQLEFVNDCAKITLGAVIGVLSQRGNGK